MGGLLGAGLFGMLLGGRFFGFHGGFRFLGLLLQLALLFLLARWLLRSFVGMPAMAGMGGYARGMMPQAGLGGGGNGFWPVRATGRWRWRSRIFSNSRNCCSASRRPGALST